MTVKDLITALKKMPQKAKISVNDEILGRYYDSADCAFDVFENEDEVTIAIFRPGDYE